MVAYEQKRREEQEVMPIPCCPQHNFALNKVIMTGKDNMSMVVWVCPLCLEKPDAAILMFLDEENADGSN